MPLASTTKSGKQDSDDSLINPRWLALLVAAFVLGTEKFQTFWSKERGLVAAGEEIVTVLRAYRDASPGTAKTYPIQLSDLYRDPRMLADKGDLLAIPLDPVILKQEWGTIKNKNNEIIGVHSLSSATPTFFSTLFLFRRGAKYSEELALGHWKFMAE